jgi:hypothetical protein
MVKVTAAGATSCEQASVEEKKRIEEQMSRQTI